jgi:hypothetical protein
LVASERSERVTNFIFCRAGWYFSVSIIFTDIVNYLQTTGAWGMDFVSSSPLFIRFSSFDNISRRHTSWIIRVFCIHSFSTDIYCISEYDWYWKIS